jgi:uncharacterized protein (DUF924 family)
MDKAKEMDVADPQAVLDFWTKDLTQKDWYMGGDALDTMCADRFGATWAALKAGKLEDWRSDPKTILAYILVADQMSRNMHRDKADAFATDGLARAAAKQAIEKGWDKRVAGPERQFFYMPLTHSECLEDQERAVRKFCRDMPKSDDNLLHARAHREVIRMFGRFPLRNTALGRKSTKVEQQYIDDNGYTALLDKFRVIEPT